MLLIKVAENIVYRGNKVDRGDRLKILRILCGFSQTDLASQLQVSQGNVATWERKNMFPRTQAIAKNLSESLQASLGYLSYGESSLKSAFWEPQPPENPRHLSSYAKEVNILLPEFCIENSIEQCAYLTASDGTLYFLAQVGERLSFAMFLDLRTDKVFTDPLSRLKKTEIAGLGNVPLFSGYSEANGIERLASCYRFVKSSGLEIDTEAISAAFLTAKRNRKAASNKDESYRRSTFMHFQVVINEFETSVPIVLYQIKPTQIEMLYQVFETVREEIEKKMIAWGGELDEGIANIIRTSLKEQGFKEKILNPVFPFKISDTCTVP